MKTKDKQSKKVFIRKIIILLCLLAISLLPLITTFSRYVIKSINEFFDRSKEFYFYSDKLGEEETLFEINNWPGVDPYQIVINLNTRENNKLGTSYNIDYTVSYTCPTNNAICELSKSSGTISTENDNSDNFVLTITPNARYSTGDRVDVTITASVTEPYEKTISGKFSLIVGKENIEYKIEDSRNSPYLEVNITNTQSYYIVDTPFDSHTSGERINIDDYLALTDENKSKCHSARITLTFNPNDVTLDMTNQNYINADWVSTTTVNGYEYINGLRFDIDASSSAKVRFYKQNVEQDYSYPNVAENSIVTFSAE